VSTRFQKKANPSPSTLFAADPPLSAAVHHHVVFHRRISARLLRREPRGPPQGRRSTLPRPRSDPPPRCRRSPHSRGRHLRHLHRLGESQPADPHRRDRASPRCVECYHTCVDDPSFCRYSVLELVLLCWCAWVGLESGAPIPHRPDPHLQPSSIREHPARTKRVDERRPRPPP